MIISLVLMGKARFHWLCFPFLRLTGSFRRCPPSRRTWIIGIVCVIYLFFVVSQFGYSQQSQDRRTDRDKFRHTRGLYNLETSDVLPDSVPTRSNVVYITLKTKRLKPANIRGTIRPKLRRKVRRNITAGAAFTHNKLVRLEQDARQVKRNFQQNSSFGETRDVTYKSLDLHHKHLTGEKADSIISSIRIYSQKAPPWLSAQDVKAMRFLADAKVLRVKEVSHGDSPSLLIFQGESGDSVNDPKHTERHDVCGGRCGVINSPVDNTEVFAFHLDRVLGLNRTLPAVSRKFSFLHGESRKQALSFIFSD